MNIIACRASDIDIFELVEERASKSSAFREALAEALCWGFVQSFAANTQLFNVAKTLVLDGLCDLDQLGTARHTPTKGINESLKEIAARLREWRELDHPDVMRLAEPPGELVLVSLDELGAAIEVALEEEQESEVLSDIEAQVKPSWANERTEHSSSDEPPLSVPPTPKIPAWLGDVVDIILPDSRRPTGAMAAKKSKAGPLEVTRQLEFSQDDCNFWVEVRLTSGRTRVVLCSEDKGRLSLVQAIAFGSDVAEIEHIGNDAVVKIDRIVLDFYIHRFESNKGTVPCPTLIFSRNG